MARGGAEQAPALRFFVEEPADHIVGGAEDGGVGFGERLGFEEADHSVGRDFAVGDAAGGVGCLGERALHALLGSFKEFELAVVGR